LTGARRLSSCREAVPGGEGRTLEPKEPEGEKTPDEGDAERAREESEGSEGSGYTEEEEAQVAKRLEDLGYL
jgi:hypothetical protein